MARYPCLVWYAIIACRWEGGFGFLYPRISPSKQSNFPILVMAAILTRIGIHLKYSAKRNFSSYSCTQISPNIIVIKSLFRDEIQILIIFSHFSEIWPMYTMVFVCLFDTLHDISKTKAYFWPNMVEIFWLRCSRVVLPLGSNGQRLRSQSAFS